LFGQMPKYGFLEVMILFRMEMLTAVCYVLRETSDKPWCGAQKLMTEGRCKINTEVY
jgi:hypothetical protein